MLEKMVEAQGITPPALERRPVLNRYQMWLAEEFRKLSRDRRYSESGPLALSTLDIRVYYDAFKMHSHCFDDFHSWMTKIDDAWLAQVTARTEKARAQAEFKAKSAR